MANILSKESTIMSEKIICAVKKAFAKELQEHKRNKRNIWAIDNGKVAEIPWYEIETELSTNC